MEEERMLCIMKGNIYMVDEFGLTYLFNERR